MNFFYRIITKIKRIYYTWKIYLNVLKKSKKNKRKIFLIGTPWYGNIGDQAITIGEKYIIGILFKDYKIIEIPYEVYMSKLQNFFKFNIEEDDIIFLQGGGNLGSLYKNEENLRRLIINEYKNNKIIIMPVSIFFHENNFGKQELEKSMQIYNRHNNLTIMSRDEISYNFAKKFFYKVNNVLVPDIVTSLEETIDNKNIKRDGVQFFLRSDIEKILSNEVVEKLKKYLIEKKIKYNVKDTTIKNLIITKSERKEKFLSRLLMASKSRLVITDRFHGLVFSVITHTPVIVFKSFDTKIESGIKWFSNLDWVYYVKEDDLENVYGIIRKYCLKEEIIISDKINYRELIVEKIKEKILK